jgi:hypothetical protein
MLYCLDGLALTEGTIKASNSFIGIPEGKARLGKSKYVRENNMKVVIRKYGM